ncbi:MAG: phosphoribosylformylglycinamidine cyclo-ligase [Saprospiraceae bacterium]|nr:phosphoribosylformylglycinamidine cyclo-ligase [Saprospiraceae bacterium]
MTNRYEGLGVSASKEEIHKAITKLDKGLFPNAFCKILPDLSAGSEDYCNIIHADTAGTKTSLAYLYWKETNDISIWDGIAQDALVMNIDDLACAGVINNIVISSTIGRNKHLIPGEIIERIVYSTQNLLDQLQKLGIDIYSGGGETADVGDIVRTIDVGITAFARIKRDEVVSINIRPGASIVGFESSGLASYENEYNSGIGSNGLTAARHDILDKSYLTDYPESCSPETNPSFQYTGKYKLKDYYTSNSKEFEIGKLLLSPTRTYLPLIRNILAEHRSHVQGIIHCTGGAQTKVKKFIKKLKIVKDNLFEVPPVFEMLKALSLCSEQELYQVYNMGHRLEVYIEPQYVNSLIDIAKLYNISAKVIGYTEEYHKEEIVIKTGQSQYFY